MRNRKSIAVLVALAFVITLMTAVGSSAQSASNVRPVQVPQGEKQKVQGVVSVRSGDSFKVRDPGGAETTVLLTCRHRRHLAQQRSKGQKGIPGDLHHAWSAFASPGKGRCGR